MSEMFIVFVNDQLICSAEDEQLKSTKKSLLESILRRRTPIIKFFRHKFWVNMKSLNLMNIQ